MTPRFLPEAEEDFIEAARYYDTKAPGVGMAFIAEVHKAVAAITAQPFAGSEMRRGIRKKILPHFPYSLIYSIQQDIILIIAVAHHRRRPTFWHKRV